MRTARSVRSTSVLLLAAGLSACASPRQLANPATYGIRGGVNDYVDLAPRNVTLERTTLAPGETITVSLEVENIGALDCYEYPIHVLASAGNAEVEIGVSKASGLKSRATERYEVVATAPTTPGSYRLHVFVDRLHTVGDETHCANNVSPGIPITVQ